MLSRKRFHLKHGARGTYLLDPYPFAHRMIHKQCNESLKLSQRGLQRVLMLYRTHLLTNYAAQLRLFTRTGSHNRPTQQVIKINKINDNPALLRPQTLSLSNGSEPTHTCIPPTRPGCVMCDAFKTPLRDETRFTVSARQGVCRHVSDCKVYPLGPGVAGQHSLPCYRYGLQMKLSCS